jgi:hypothetical protein
VHKELTLSGTDLGGVNFGPSSKFRYGFVLFQRLDDNLRFEGSRQFSALDFLSEKRKIRCFAAGLLNEAQRVK